MTGPSGNSEFCFPSNLNVLLSLTSGNIEVSGKQNSLFPLGPVIKCLIFTEPEANNRPRSIYQYSNMVPRLSGQNCKFFKFLLSVNSQRTLGYKENNTKYRSLTRKPRSHVRILIYRTWPIVKALLGRVFMSPV